MSSIVVRCQNCKNISLGDNFCTGCGFAIARPPSQVISCPKCHATRSFLNSAINYTSTFYATFCGQCGFNFEDGSA